MRVKLHKPVVEGGKIVAFADVTIEGITIKGFRVLDNDRGLYVRSPSRPIVVEGKTKYIDQIEFEDQASRERVHRLVREAYRNRNV